MNHAPKDMPGLNEMPQEVWSSLNDHRSAIPADDNLLLDFEQVGLQSRLNDIERAGDDGTAHTTNTARKQASLRRGSTRMALSYSPACDEVLP